MLQDFHEVFIFSLLKNLSYNTYLETMKTRQENSLQFATSLRRIS